MKIKLMTLQLVVIFLVSACVSVDSESISSEVPAATLPTAATKAQPCQTLEYHQFDFWIGDWTVTTPDGKYAGKNTITPILNACVLHESWTGKSGYRGESFNVYDTAAKQWHQTWVDYTGGILKLDGTLVDGNMVLMGPGIDADGNDIINRITWTPNADGTVRQHWEVSNDNTQTWQSAFDGLYTKVLSQE